MMIDRCGKSIVEPRFSNSLEGYIVVDPFIFNIRSEVPIKIMLRNYGVDKRVSIEVKVCDIVLDKRTVKISFGEKYEFGLTARIYDKCVVELIVEGLTLDSQEVKVINLSKISRPTNILLTLHNHQPPNYGPDIRYRSLWPFYYVWAPILSPYGLGPYHYQASLIKKMGKDIKLVYNLSPSLIAQWVAITRDGIGLAFGETIEPSSDLAKIVKETIDLYRELADMNIVEVLTSIYAHTIAGYVVDVLGLEDVIYRELEYGYSITKEFIGRNPKGVWLPEMSFSMKLIYMLSSLNLEYTFLDEKYHLRAAQGEISDHFEPYIVQDPVTGESITVFFRDTELSNTMGFSNNYCSDIHAVKGAYVFAQKLVEKAVAHKAKVLTLALDGENWMIFSRNPPATAIFLSTLLDILSRLSREGFVRLSHPGDVLNEVPPTKKIKFIPSTTWLGSYTKWRGEVDEHEAMWQLVENRIAKYKNYVAKHGYDEKARKAEWALWHVLDSDYWWAEFWNKEAIMMWLNELDKFIT